MNGETKPIKGFAVINFPTDLLVTLLSNGEVVTQAISEYLYNNVSTNSMYNMNDENPAEDQVDSFENVSPFKHCISHNSNIEDNIFLNLNSNY